MEPAHGGHAKPGKELAPDLSAFPLLRMDQLDRVDAATLRRSLALLPELEHAGQARASTYAARQRRAIVDELASRQPPLLGQPPPPPPPLSHQLLLQEDRAEPAVRTPPSATPLGAHRPKVKEDAVVPAATRPVSFVIQAPRPRPRLRPQHKTKASAAALRSWTGKGRSVGPAVTARLLRWVRRGSQHVTPWASMKRGEPRRIQSLPVFIRTSSDRRTLALKRLGEYQEGRLRAAAEATLEELTAAEEGGQGHSGTNEEARLAASDEPVVDIDAACTCGGTSSLVDGERTSAPASPPPLGTRTTTANEKQQHQHQQQDHHKYRRRLPSPTCLLSQFHGVSPSAPPPIAQVDRALRRQLEACSAWRAYASSAEGLGSIGHHRAATLYFSLTAPSRPEVLDILSDVFMKHFPQWRPLPGALQGAETPHWNLHWSWRRASSSQQGEASSSLLVVQRVNHIPNSRQLTRKDLLHRHLRRFAALPPGQPSQAGGTFASFDIAPETFSLPQDYTEFVGAFVRASRCSGREASGAPAAGRRCAWIVKPIESSRGRGIKLVDDVADLVYSETAVVQRYVANPLLLGRGQGRYKFDLRLYVLVTSFQPLEAFLYREGFARLCTKPFSLEQLGDPLVHLTNSSVQNARAAKALLPEDHPLRAAPPEHVGGSKLRLSHLLELLQREKGVDAAALWEALVALVLTSLVCVEDAIPASANGFELFGYDVLIDDGLRPWLLEVNASPSMARENQLDAEIKEAVLRDTIRLLDPVPYDREALQAALAHRLQGRQQKQQQRLPRKDGGDAGAVPNEQLRRICSGRLPRQLGEVPACLGNYERLCPGTEAHRRIVAHKHRVLRATAAKKGSAGKT